MHIKSITLRGFLCYKEATTVTFHPGLNVIVGPNGSGKSSLLSGIQFAMVEPSSDKNLCLHQGAGSKMLVGYVSLVFDNSDGRLTGFDCEEVTIRRDFSAQKDELTVNGKRMMRTELLSILEAAGFSRSNPYYYAHQHEIAALARMTNVERLKVLKECAGTRVYDERRAEAAISLEETRARRATIDNTLELILKRLHELQAEHDELQQVLDIEREIHCVEALLSQKDYEIEEKKAQKIQKKSDQLRAKYSGLEEKLASARSKMSALDEQSIADTAQLLSVKALIKESEQDVLEAKKEVERLETRFEEERETLQLNAEVLRVKERQLSEWAEKEEHVELELGRVRTELDNARKEKEAVVVNLLETRRSTRQYVADGKSFSQNDKQLRERDAAEINAEMQNLEALCAELQGQWEVCVSEREAHMEEKVLLDGKISAVEVQLCQHSRVLKELMDAEERCLQKKKVLQETLASLRGERDGVVWQIQLAKQKRDKTWRPAQLTALQAALRYDAERVSGGAPPEVLGLLLENIRVAPKYFAAVEAAAGTQLFNLLVKNKNTAKALVPRIKESGGFLTLVPIEEIAGNMQDNHAHASSAGTRNDRHAPPLLDFIRCVNDAVAPAVHQVFGHYFLVDNCDIGRAKRFSDFDCVTLAGDVVTKKKTLRGGGRPPHQVARLRCQADVWDAEETLERHREEEERSSAALEAVQVELTTTRAQINEARASHNQGVQELRRLKDQLRKWTAKDRRLAVRYDGVASSLSEVKVQRASVERALKEVNDHARYSAKENNAATAPLREESKEPRDVGKHICALEKETSLITETVQKLEISAEKLEKIRENISARVAALRSEIGELAATAQASEHLRKRSQHDIQEDRKADILLERSRQALQEREVKNRSLGEQRQQILKSQKMTEKRRVQLEDESERMKRDIDLVKAEMSLVSEALTSARLRCENLTAKLKSIPGSSKQFDQYSSSTYQELEITLETLNKKLRTYSAVNRKALDQFARFSAEEKRLVLQQEELRKSEKAIVHLITSLDNQKDATLLKTFENVNLQFGMVFDAIVPGGKAKLVLKTVQKPTYDDCKNQGELEEGLSAVRTRQAAKENMFEVRDAQAIEEDEREERCDVRLLNTSGSGSVLQAGSETVLLESPTAVDQCITGMAIKVRFPAARRYMPLESLSGGQKSAVALALMFALQRVESAPFYALDEIDANLDPQYRGAVAQLVQKQSQDHQIIVISHKPQTVQAGDWFLEARSAHQVATVVPTSRVDALALIQVQWAGVEVKRWLMEMMSVGFIHAEDARSEKSL